MISPRASLSAFAIAALSACAAPGAPGDLAFEGDAQDLGKADHAHVELAVTSLDVAVPAGPAEAAEHAIFTSAESFESYFGVAAPADVDWSREWVAFYSAGAQSSGGFDAGIDSMVYLPELGGLVVGSHLRSPGPSCIVPFVVTTPRALVKFELPAELPTWYAVDHSDEVRDCQPDPGDRFAQLADSRETWEAAAAAHGDSYVYTTGRATFFGLEWTTTLVVEQGEVVERHYRATSGADVVTWSEVGADELGTHDEGDRIATIDDLYAQCELEILTQDDQRGFMHLAFDDQGFLQACTYTPEGCQDGCDRGPRVSSIEL